MRLAPKVDANHTEIVGAFRQLGCSVLVLAAMGKGCPDLLVGLPGHNFLVEVKDGSLPQSQRYLTRDQKNFHATWRGPCHVIMDIASAIDLVAFYRGTIRRPRPVTVG